MCCERSVTEYCGFHNDSSIRPFTGYNQRVLYILVDFQYVQQFNFLEFVFLQLRSVDGLHEALLGLVKVDDIPNSVHVVSLDVEVLEVEGMLPDINTDQGNEREKRVLVWGGGKLKSLSGRVHTL
jgi:hypothetical protein